MGVLSYFEGPVKFQLYKLRTVCIVLKCNFFSVVPWQHIVKHFQIYEGRTHFCEIQYVNGLEAPAAAVRVLAGIDFEGFVFVPHTLMQSIWVPLETMQTNLTMHGNLEIALLPLNQH